MACAALSALGACSDTLPPRGQVLLYFDTDAPVPALFDGLTVDVYKPGDSAPCALCTRSFALTEAMFHQPAGVSIGIPLPPDQKGWIVRARLFTSSATLTGRIPEPTGGVAPPSVIDVFASLPAIAETGIVERTLSLHVDDVGVPVGGLDAPVETRPGREATTVGSWQGAISVPCKGTARADEVCVPGGAFWMGNPRIVETRVPGAAPGYIAGASDTRRLVVVSPFFLKRTEVTVGEFRKVPSPPSEVTPWSGLSTGNGLDDYCTYTTVPGSREDLPVNCVQRVAAQAYCKAWGGAFPTEAQFEFVGSRSGAALFPWGSLDEPTCDDACFGRSGWGRYSNLIARCQPAIPPGGPVPVGSKSLDRVHFAEGDAVDLGGNLSEFMIDRWNRQDEPCWAKPGILVDPLCTAISVDGPAWSVRGGAWHQEAFALAAARRTGLSSSITYGLHDLGFRCARPSQ